MTPFAAPTASTLNRRLVLAVALAIGIAAASFADGPDVRAQPSTPDNAAAAPAPGAAHRGAGAAPAAAKPSGAPSDDTANGANAGEPAAADAEITVGPGGVRVDRHGRHVHVFGVTGDRDFDSFDQMVREEPWLAGLIFFSVALFFAVPLLIVIAVIWYKMRRARMLNDTMLRLAEKGVVPPAGAIDALASNRPEAAERLVVASAPAAEQLRIATRRTVWSDLRKGVMLMAVGIGMQAWSAIEDGSPSGLGLVVLLVGVGYVVLWWYEERQIAPRGGGPAAGP